MNQAYENIKKCEDCLICGSKEIKSIASLSYFCGSCKWSFYPFTYVAHNYIVVNNNKYFFRAKQDSLTIYKESSFPGTKPSDEIYIELFNLKLNGFDDFSSLKELTQEKLLKLIDLYIYR